MTVPTDTAETESLMNHSENREEGAVPVQKDVGRKRREPEFDAAEVRAISIAVYKARLVDGSGDGAVERMIADDEDNGEKLVGRAAAYDGLTRCYMREIRKAGA